MDQLSLGHISRQLGRGLRSIRWSFSEPGRIIHQQRQRTSTPSPTQYVLPVHQIQRSPR